MKHRTITALLAVIAVLLGLNLTVRWPREVQAMGPAGDADPYIVRAFPVYASPPGIHVIRVWSDGQIDFMEFLDSATCEHQTFAIWGPADPPPAAIVHAELVTDPEIGGFGVTLVYADGSAELVVPFRRCSLGGGESAAFCSTDHNRDGVVDVVDFLALLGQWGPCN